MGAPPGTNGGMDGVMVRLLGVTKAFHLGGTSKAVLRDASIDLPRGRAIALLGRNGAGKSSLLRMIAGTVRPDRGEIVVAGAVSWPVGFQGSFHPDLSGAQNARFLARVYGVDTGELLDFVEDFAELGAHFHQPLRTYSSGMRARLGFGVSMAIRFDVYLVDEVTAVGDGAFRARSEALFRDRMQGAGALFVSHSMGSVRDVCDAALILEDGDLRYFDDIDEGIAEHERNLLAAPRG